MQYVYKDGKIIRSERIVAGMIDKQSSIFSRPLKYVVLRPQWRVPESIKVNEIWPSLIRGGGYMRQYALELESKDGKRLDWRKFDWVKTDIRNYEVVQPSGPKSVLGKVKFTFPSQHTIFMQDKPVLESQFPKRLPLDLRAELHTAADKASSAYRRHLKMLGITFGVC